MLHVLTFSDPTWWLVHLELAKQMNKSRVGNVQYSSLEMWRSRSQFSGCRIDCILRSFLVETRCFDFATYLNVTKLFAESVEMWSDVVRLSSSADGLLFSTTSNALSQYWTMSDAVRVLEWPMQVVRWHGFRCLPFITIFSLSQILDQHQFSHDD